MKFFKHNQQENKLKVLDYTYTSQPSINTALPLSFSKLRLVLFIISCICTLGFVWLLAKWSSRKKAIMLFSVCNVQQATHFLIEEEDGLGGASIVHREDKFQVKRREIVVGFVYHDRHFLYHLEKQVFLPIRYEDLGIQLDRLQKNKYQPHSQRTRRKLLQYYGLNQIQLIVQNSLQIFIEQMLTPYQVFQLYAIILWISEQYYIFPILLLAYSLYTYWVSSKEVVKNQKKLAEKSLFNVMCKVLVKGKTRISNKVIEEDEQGNSEDFSIMEEEIKSHSDELYQKKQLNEVLQNHHYSDQAEAFNMQEQLSQRKFQGKAQITESKNIIPGDIIILKQGDTIPCDCVLIHGQAIVDQSYISGQNYLTRKVQIENYQYNKDRQKVFLLYLGTKIAKVKNYTFSKKKSQQEKLSSLLQSKQIMCIVTQTNYNTQRGKYLRAIRYQKKPTDNFTKESIYFIYIIIVITVIAFVALYPIIYKGQSTFDLFILFLDLLATSIPITLPTALSVGINFAQHRLVKAGIRSILPSNILSGGRATTIVMDTNQVLAKNYQVSSIVVGTKNNSIGTTYSSLSQFLDLTNASSSSVTQTETYMADPQKKLKQIKSMQERGKMLIQAFSCCHSLEKYNNQLSGTTQQKHLYDFAQTKYVDEDEYECLGHRLKVCERVYFKEKDKKFAVVVDIADMGSREEKSIKCEDLMEEEVIKDKSEGLKQKMIFIKGPAQTIIKLCRQDTYPQNYNDYIVDISQKGFKTICFAYKNHPQQPPSSKMLQHLLSQQFTFSGFALLQAQKKQDTLDTISQLKQAKMQMVLISQQNQLQAGSLAISNQVCSKNQLILCRQLNGRVQVSGHLEWVSAGNGDDLNQFIMESESLFKNSYLSLNSKLYQELFMKRDQLSSQGIFKKAIIYNQMENRHIRNIYFQLDRRNKVTFAVGSGSSVSECAHLSMELERGQCSMLSSFHTNEKSLKCVTDCLIICRAALATNFHCFSMMILFSMVQFTTVANLYAHHQILSDFQMLYEDLFVTFPIFVTINMTLPVQKLSKQLPLKSFFSPRPLASMIGQFLIQLVTQILFINYVFGLQHLRPQMEQANQQYYQTQQFVQTNLTLATFILTNYLYLGIVLSTSVSKPFRKPFYTNPYYTVTLVVLWLYNTAIVLLPEIVPRAIRPLEVSQEIQEILVLAMLLGNLVMIIMYLYENCLVWISGVIRYAKPKTNVSNQLGLS